MKARAAVVLVVALLLLAVTGPKLRRMARIRGWLPGATFVTVKVTSKEVRGALDPRRLDALVVHWEPAVAGARSENVGRALWDRLRPGDPLVVAVVDGEVDVREGIYADSGNFGFDGALLTAELAAVLWALWVLVWDPERRAAEASKARFDAWSRGGPAA